MPLLTETEVLRTIMAAAVAGPHTTKQGPVYMDSNPATLSQVDLRAALAARRAVRRFAADLPPASALAELLATASARSAFEAPDPADRLSVTVAGAERLTLPPGIARMDDSDLLAELRHDYMAAPLFLLFHAAPRDPADYIGLLQAAAARAYATWVHSTALGIGACMLGSPSGTLAAYLRARHQPAEQHLVTLAVGIPAGPSTAGPAPALALSDTTEDQA